VPRQLRRRPAAALVAILGLVTAGTAALSAPPDALPTSSAKLADKAVTKTYAVLDAKGRKAGKAKWSVTTAGGNCCEVLVAATRTGRLLEFGGQFPVYSDDKGKSWTEIRTVVPATGQLDDSSPRQVGGGEGTIVMAPGGDIVGVGWDPYSGDRLQSFLYDAKAKTWHYHEAPLHEPFYDREWMAVAKGPFTIAGQTVPWVSMVLSNFNRRVVLMSTDGLHYFRPSRPQLEAIAGGTVSSIPVVPDADLDYMQEHSETGISPLPGGGAISLGAVGEETCATQVLRKDGTWACLGGDGSFEFKGRLHSDSRGWLHDVVAIGDTVTYRLSRDGGRSWKESTFAVPGEANIESWDFKAHGKLGLSAIALHVQKDDKNHQDMVMRIDTRKGVAKLKDTLLVGDGNMSFTSGLDVGGVLTNAKSNRFDFATVAILPDGKLAVGFVDKTYDDPAVAVLQ
jgi:hypothetical protein